MLTEFRMTLIANSEVVCFRVISNNLRLKSTRKDIFFQIFDQNQRDYPFFENTIFGLITKLAIRTKNRSFKVEIGHLRYFFFQKLPFLISIRNLRGHSITKSVFWHPLKKTWLVHWRSCMRILNPIRTKNVPTSY